MRPRTFALLIIVLIAVGALIAFLVLRNRGDDQQADVPPTSQPAESAEEGAQEPSEEAGEPLPTATPQVQNVEVVVAVTDLPVGQRIRPDLIRKEVRPDTNVAVVAGVTFSDPELVVGKIVKAPISKGQEILRPMLALNPSDIAGIGSDLSLYVDQGEVAVAFPINRFSGAAYAIRPGDLVDAFMSLTMVDLDEEFQTELPNMVQRVNENALVEGQAFLFPETSAGRLELIPGINAVALIAPGAGKEPVPRRVTQLTVQQMEVLWVGSWRNPEESMEQEYDSEALTEAELAAIQQSINQGTLPPIEGPRPEVEPDIVILSMTAQDALALKWALETGINIDLVLRGQGDNTVFVTTSVSLPQIFEQGVIAAPESSEVGLQPRIDLVPTPGVPAVPPGTEATTP